MLPHTFTTVKSKSPLIEARPCHRAATTSVSLLLSTPRGCGVASHAALSLFLETRSVLQTQTLATRALR
jgi:hypothetical protein